MSADVFNIRPLYDDKGDVLYLTRLAMPATRTHEDEDGWIWRYDAGGTLVGVTILDPKDDWPDHGDRMVEKLAAAFALAPEAIASLLDKALKLH